MSAPRGLDPIGMFIVHLHRMLGHDVAARTIGAPAYDKRKCLICAYERDPCDEAREAVYRALAPEAGKGSVAER